jgi:hypothetical protein
MVLYYGSEPRKTRLAVWWLGKEVAGSAIKNWESTFASGGISLLRKNEVSATRQGK